MLAEHSPGRPLHLLDIERMIQRIDISRKRGRANLPAKDTIFVKFSSGAVPGMKTLGCMLRRQHADRGWQRPVEGADQIPFGNGGCKRKRCYLALRMHPGIGATRTLRKNIFSGDAFNGRAELALDCRLLGLDLPPVKLRAVIGEHQLPNLALAGNLIGHRHGLVGHGLLGQGW